MEEFDLKELAKVFWEKRFEIIVVVLLCAILGGIYSFKFTTPVYTSYTKIVLTTDENSENNTITPTDISLNSKLVSTYATLIQSKNVIRQVVDNLGINIDEEELKKSIAVNLDANTDLIKISVTLDNPEEAASIANEITNVFTKVINEFYNVNNVHIVDKAKVSEQPSNINHIRDLAIFVLGGLFLAGVSVLLTNMFDTTVKSATEIEKKFNVTVLAEMPLHNFDNTKKKGKDE